MTDDEIDELREQTRGTDRISAEVTDGDEDKDGSDDVFEDIDGDEDGTEEMSGDGRSGSDDSDAAAEGPTPSEAFADALAERLDRTETGVDPATFSGDDAGLSALLLALQDTGDIDEVGEELRDSLGARAPPEYDRDALVRLALTYALRERAPGYFEELAEGA